MRVSGPPRLSNNTPTLSSTPSGVVLAVRVVSAVTSAFSGGKHFRSDKSGEDCAAADEEEEQFLERATQWEEETERTRGRSLWWSEGMEEEMV